MQTKHIPMASFLVGLFINSLQWPTLCLKKGTIKSNEIKVGNPTRHIQGSHNSLDRAATHLKVLSDYRHRCSHKPDVYELELLIENLFGDRGQLEVYMSFNGIRKKSRGLAV